MTHAELRALGLTELARRESQAMRANTGWTPQNKAHDPAPKPPRDFNRFVAEHARMHMALFAALSGGPRTTTQLTAITGLTNESTRGHLMRMQDEGKVKRIGHTNRSSWVQA